MGFWKQFWSDVFGDASSKVEETSKAQLLPEESAPQQEEGCEIEILEPEVREVPPIPRKPRKAAKKSAKKSSKKVAKKK